jgi:serine/threonine-protein kinase
MGTTQLCTIATSPGWSGPARGNAAPALRADAFPDLQLERVLGVGGMAKVYAATRRDGTRVAVKVLHARHAGSEQYRALMRREAAVMRAIDHPGVVQVLELALPERAAPYLVLELLEGHSVAVLASGPARCASARDVAGIADQLLDVLAATHSRGVIHHDIKPDNLFLTNAGQLKLLDFGIASAQSGLQENVRALRATTLGTPAFMSHEQARGRWDEVDQRSDLWAVGASMFTLLTGEAVHPAQTRDEQLARAMSLPPRALAALRPDLPFEFAEVIDRALAFERDQRWPDADTMRCALQEAMPAIGNSEPHAAAASQPVFASSAVRRVRSAVGACTTTDA